MMRRFLLVALVALLVVATCADPTPSSAGAPPSNPFDRPLSASEVVEASPAAVLKVVNSIPDAPIQAAEGTRRIVLIEKGSGEVAPVPPPGAVPSAEKILVDAKEKSRSLRSKHRKHGSRRSRHSSRRARRHARRRRAERRARRKAKRAARKARRKAKRAARKARREARRARRLAKASPKRAEKLKRRWAKKDRRRAARRSRRRQRRAAYRQKRRERRKARRAAYKKAKRSWRKLSRSERRKARKHYMRKMRAKRRARRAARKEKRKARRAARKAKRAARRAARSAKRKARRAAKLAKAEEEKKAKLQKRWAKEDRRRRRRRQAKKARRQAKRAKRKAKRAAKKAKRKARRAARKARREARKASSSSSSSSKSSSKSSKRSSKKKLTRKQKEAKDLLRSIRSVDTKKALKPRLSSTWLSKLRAKLDSIQDAQDDKKEAIKNGEKQGPTNEQEYVQQKAARLVAKNLRKAIEESARTLQKVEEGKISATDLNQMKGAVVALKQAKRQIKSNIKAGAILDPKNGKPVNNPSALAPVLATAQAKADAMIRAVLDEPAPAPLKKPFSYGEHLENPRVLKKLKKKISSSSAPAAPAAPLPLTSSSCTSGNCPRFAQVDLDEADETVLSEMDSEAEADAEVDADSDSDSDSDADSDSDIDAEFDAALEAEQQADAAADADADSDADAEADAELPAERSLAELPPGVLGDGHAEMMMKTVEEVMRLDNPSANYKGQVNAQGQLCQGCQQIVYNHDSPISDDDKKLIHAQHNDLVLDDVKLHAQSTLDRATLMVDDAAAMKKKLLDQYPTAADSLIQFDIHN